MLSNIDALGPGFERVAHAADGAYVGGLLRPVELAAQIRDVELHDARAYLTGYAPDGI
jgi:hypothetical protein